MELTIIARKGAQSTNEIGKYLLSVKTECQKSKYKFNIIRVLLLLEAILLKSKYKFNIIRVLPQEEASYLKNGIKQLPVLIYNKKAHYTAQNIINQLKILLLPEKETLEDYQFGPGEYKKVNGQIVFDDEDDNDNLEDRMHLRLQEFAKQREENKKLVMTVDKDKINNGITDIEDYVVEEHEIDIENHIAANRRGFR